MQDAGVKNVSPWVWRAAGGLAVIAIIGSVVFTSGAYKLIRLPARQLALNCLPSDFPSYPGMTIVGASYSHGHPAPDATTTCTMSMESRDKYTDVEGFYKKALKSDPWKTTSLLVGQDSMQIGFQLVERPPTRGWVTVARSAATDVGVSLFS